MDINLYAFLKGKASSIPFSPGNKLTELITLHAPTETIGNNEIGYVYYNNGFRIGYTQDTVTELGIDFNYTDHTYRLFTANKEIGSINKHSKLHEVLNLLNEAQIKYRCINIRDNDDYLTFLTEGMFV